MRKKTLNSLFDNVMWYLLYLLPIFAFLIMLFNSGDVSLISAMNSCGLGVATTGGVYGAINSIIGVDGILPFFASVDMIAYFTWFVYVMIGHLLVDFLVFIPRLAHKFSECLYGDKE